MSSLRRIAQLPHWLPLLAVLMAACGGGDKSPTGPTGGGNGGGGDSQQLELVSLGLVGLPADLQLEDCTLTRFYGGALQLDTRTGSWRITLQVHDGNYGDFSSEDYGQMETDGSNTVWFNSAVSGSNYQGTAGGGEVNIMYDWCYNGVPDVQLVFAQ